MKVIGPAIHFTPFTITVTIESQEEVVALRRLCHYREVVVNTMTAAYDFQKPSRSEIAAIMQRFLGEILGKLPRV